MLALQIYNFIANAIQWLEVKAELHNHNCEKKMFILDTLKRIAYLSQLLIKGVYLRHVFGLLKYIYLPAFSFNYRMLFICDCLSF